MESSSSRAYIAYRVPRLNGCSMARIWPICRGVPEIRRIDESGLAGSRGGRTRLHNRQEHADRRPALPLFNGHQASRIPHDGVGHGQTADFPADARFEQARAVTLGQSRAIVGDAQPRVAAGRRLVRIRAWRCPHFYPGRIQPDGARGNAASILGVEDQVEQHLFERAPVDVHEQRVPRCLAHQCQRVIQQIRDQPVDSTHGIRSVDQRLASPAGATSPGIVGREHRGPPLRH